MKLTPYLLSMTTVLLLTAVLSTAYAQPEAVARLRELREKARAGTLTAAEKTELDKTMAAREAKRQGASAAPQANSPAPGTPAPSVADRLAKSRENQAAALARMRQQGAEALSAAQARALPTGPAREFYVNNETGDDKASGLAAKRTANDGPVRTLAKAVKLLRAGDTLHLAATRRPYRETLRLNNGFGGVEGKPIVIDGHGATILGCDPLRLAGWEEAGAPGLYKCARLSLKLEESNEEAMLGRVFFVFDGAVQHMGRTMKGAKAPFKAPAELKPGEWTYVAAEQNFYIKVAGKLADAKIEAPYRLNGVSISASKVAVTHVVIKNVVATRVLNDGFNLHGTTRDVLLQNIASYECGDDGFSPHETCESEIDGFWAVGNSTGMCPINFSVTKARNIHLEGNLGQQFMAMNSAAAELSNTVLIPAPHAMAVNLGNAQGQRLKLDNVQIGSEGRQQIMIGPGASLEARRLTAVGAVWDNRGTAKVTESVLGAGKVTCLAGASWEGRRNAYDPKVTPPPGEVAPTVRPVNAEILKLAAEPFPGMGADPGKFKIPPRPAVQIQDSSR